MGEAAKPVAIGAIGGAGKPMRCVGPVASFRVGADSESEGSGGRQHGARLLLNRNSGSTAS